MAIRKRGDAIKARPAASADFSAPRLQPGQRVPLVTIVRPPALVYKWADAGPLTPPIGPAYLAASLRQAGIRVKVIDAIGENPTQANELGNGLISQGLTSEETVALVDPRTDVIGFSVMFSQDWLECRKTIRMVREKYSHMLIVVGGEHATALAEELIATCPEVDVCVSGEGEEAFVQLVKTFIGDGNLSTVGAVTYRKDGKVLTTPPGSRIRNVDDIPRPAWDLVPIQAYLDLRLAYGVDLGRTIPMLATRGCPYECTFCSSPLMWTTRYLMRKPEDVLDEIEGYMKTLNATNFDFYDLTMVIKKDWILEFARMIKTRDLTFTWQLPSGTRSEALDDNVLRALFETGCRNITYAPESGSEEELVRIKKRVDLDRMMESMKLATRHGLNIKTNIILGFPNQTRRDIWKTVRFVFRMALAGVHDTGVSMFSPYPGTELFEELQAKGVVPKPLDDRYYLRLSGYKDLTRSIAYSEHVSSKAIGVYRLLILLLFYGVQFAVRPQRFVRLVANFVRARQDSRLDKSLRDMYNRVAPNQDPVQEARR